MTEPKRPAAPEAHGKPASTPAPAPAGAGSTKPRDDASWDDDEGTDWRHAPVAPKDRGVLDSLGRSVSEVVTGSMPEDAGTKDKTTGRP